MSPSRHQLKQVYKVVSRDPLTGELQSLAPQTPAAARHMFEIGSKTTALLGGPLLAFSSPFPAFQFVVAQMMRYGGRDYDVLLCAVETSQHVPRIKTVLADLYAPIRALRPVHGGPSTKISAYLALVSMNQRAALQRTITRFWRTRNIWEAPSTLISVGLMAAPVSTVGAWQLTPLKRYLTGVGINHDQQLDQSDMPFHAMMLARVEAQRDASMSQSDLARLLSKVNQEKQPQVRTRPIE